MHRAYPAKRFRRNQNCRLDRKIGCQEGKLSLVPLRAEVDRPSDVIREFYSVIVEDYRRVVVGWDERYLCDDHYDAQRWRSREDRQSSRKVTKRI